MAAKIQNGRRFSSKYKIFLIIGSCIAVQIANVTNSLAMNIMHNLTTFKFFFKAAQIQNGHRFSSNHKIFVIIIVTFITALN